MITKITFAQLITVILLVGAFTLRALGIDSVTEWIIIGIAGAYGLPVATKALVTKMRKGKSPPG